MIENGILERSKSFQDLLRPFTILLFDIASGFLSLILETPIQALEFCNKEGLRTVLDHGPVSERLGLYHLDFKAVITNEKASQKK